jgi:hypothetical protein
MKPCLVLLVACATACGADSASSPPPSSPRPPPQPVPVAAVDECRRGCEYQAACLPAGYPDRDPAACLADCRAHLASRDPKDPGARPKQWADCLTALPCADIERSMSMNMGPAGYCYSQAAAR